MKNSTGFLTSTGNTVFGGFVIVFCYAAGASLIMWLAEKINEKGIGNGISIILFANIVATLVAQATSLVTYATESSWNVVIIELVTFGALAMVAFVVFVTNSERRLPVQYAKKQVGRKMYGGQSTTLPIKLNMSGVMPIIFANSIVAIPSTIEMIVQTKIKKGGFWDKFFDVFAYDSWVYAILFFVLIIAFSYFYILISFNPVEVANNLKKNGGFIPGIRPGKPTSDYITRVLNRITLIGALFLGIIAIVPLIVNICTGSQIGSLAFGGSSLLIVVGVILETVREIEAQMTMRHYKGFLE
jgi:preprotein translocase subunit SecY